ncbi:hypothetical protein LEMLEM_LOCUS18706 [Lemmus lemmus]
MKSVLLIMELQNTEECQLTLCITRKQ